MDPEEALRTLREMAAEAEEDGAEAWLERGPEVFQALDGWLSKGGFLPSDWRR